MKKLIIVLACVVASSSALAASITHGTSQTYSTGSGYYEFDSAYASITTNGGTYEDADGGVITVGVHNTYVHKDSAQTGLTESQGVNTSTWINAGGLVWGDTVSQSIKGEQSLTGMSSYSSDIDPYHVVTTHPDGQIVDEWVQNDSVFRNDTFSVTTVTMTDTTGIFME